MEASDRDVVAGFGEEWSKFDQSDRSREELWTAFNEYFRIFPWDELPSEPVGLDLGCGSGRWAQFVAGRVKRLYCVDASTKALGVAKRTLLNRDNCVLIAADIGRLPFPDGTMDFAYCLGVLHHTQDPFAALRESVSKLKPGAPLLLYVYYALENRPQWYRALWRMTDRLRRRVSRWPFRKRLIMSQVIASIVYLPFARLALVFEWLGLKVDSLPLAHYRRKSLYAMRTDALDRFGTRVEVRFKSDEVRRLMKEAGLESHILADRPPYWCAVGTKLGGPAPAQ
jgi:ubiquinone/menaquinone biosynthesis C-methylase UbiE